MASSDLPPRFKCVVCGLCCTFSPISILPHEDVVLRHLAKFFGLGYSSEPGYTIYDSIHGVNLALSYVFHLGPNGRCIFLREDNTCRIHNIYKPLICRSYPYVPKHVRYNISDSERIIVATSDYGISLTCPIVKRDKAALEKYAANPAIIIHYMKDEYNAAMRMEEIRNFLLYLLSLLWREGLVDLKPSRPSAPVINLYQFLRAYFPDLPTKLNIDMIFKQNLEDAVR